MLSDRYAILFGDGREGKAGVFSSDPEFLHYLKNVLHRLYQESRPFLQHARSYEALLASYYNPYLLETEGKWFSYSEQPCLCPYLTVEMAEKYIHKEQAPAGLLDGFIKSITWYRQTQTERVVEYSRLSGLRRFLFTGRMDEIPKELYDPLNIEDRLAVLDAWLETQESNPTRFLTGRDEESSRLSAHFFPGRGLNISFYADDLFCAFSTEERNLLISFDDYFNHIGEDQVLPAEEVKAVIQKMREVMKGG